jgi:hypothetical protein
MTDDTIPVEVRQFISATFDSIAQLEALMLFRATRDQEWRADSLAKRLYVDEAKAANVLQDLKSLGFLKPDGSSPEAYRYSPDSPGLARMADQVAEAYRNHLVPVTKLLHSKSKI